MTEHASAIMQRLTLLAACRAALPDSVKQTLWANALEKSPDNPVTEYLGEALRDNEFISAQLASLGESPPQEQP